MNTQKFFAAVTIVAAMLAGVAADAASSDVVSPMPRVSNVVPSFHVEREHSQTDTRTMPSQWAADVVIVADAPKAQVKRETLATWECGAPRGLENDASMTVRECGWVTR